MKSTLWKETSVKDIVDVNFQKYVKAYHTLSAMKFQQKMVQMQLFDGWDENGGFTTMGGQVVHVKKLHKDADKKWNWVPPKKQTKKAAKKFVKKIPAQKPMKPIDFEPIGKKVKLVEGVRELYKYGDEMSPAIKNIYTFYAFENYWFWLNNSERLHKMGIFIRPEHISEFEVELEVFVENLRNHLLDIIEFSCLSELRHFVEYGLGYDECEVSTKEAKEIFGTKNWKLLTTNGISCFSRSESNELFKSNIKDRKERIELAKDAFDEDLFPWDDSYGGNAWHNGCKVWLDLYSAKTLQDKLLYIDRAYDLQHNSGVLFNKHEDYEGIDSFVKAALDEKFEAEDINGLLFRDDPDDDGAFEYRCHLKYMKLFRKYYKYCHKAKEITKYNWYIYE